MPQIIADSPDVEEILTEICALVEGRGGLMHPDMVIRCEKNDISVSLEREEGDKRLLFKVPHDLMIKYDDFVLQVDDSYNISIHSHVEDIPPDELKLMELMLSLYNETEKLKSHAENSIWLVLKDHPDIINALLSASQGGDMKLIKRFIKEGALEDLLLLTFFKTRLLQCHLNKKDSPPENVIMPLMDSMNHSLKAADYRHYYSPEGEGTIGVPVSQPVEGSDECFVKYGTFDSLDTYLHYGFVDDAPFAKSVPVKIDLGEYGTIVVAALNAYVAPEDIPEQFKDMGFYMPVINIYGDKRAVLSHAILPSIAAPKSLRRVLSLAVQLMNKSIDVDKINTLMLQAEQKLVTMNLEYYSNMEKSLEKCGLAPDDIALLGSAINRQKTVIQRYVDMMG